METPLLLVVTSGVTVHVALEVCVGSMAAGNAMEPAPPLQLVCSPGLQVLPDGCTAKLVPREEGERHRLSNEVQVLQVGLGFLPDTCEDL